MARIKAIGKKNMTTLTFLAVLASICGGPFWVWVWIDRKLERIK
jgi:hypothetical protein